jgi:hypothetical protein
LEYAIRCVQNKQGGLKLNGTHHPLAYTDDVNNLGENIDPIQKNTEALFDASMEVGLEVSSENTKYISMSRKKAGQKHSVRERRCSKIQMFRNSTTRSKLHAGRD